MISTDILTSCRILVADDEPANVVMKAIRARSPREYLPVLVLTADMTRAARERAEHSAQR